MLPLGGLDDPGAKLSGESRGRTTEEVAPGVAARSCSSTGALRGTLFRPGTENPKFPSRRRWRENARFKSLMRRGGGFPVA